VEQLTQRYFKGHGTDIRDEDLKHVRIIEVWWNATTSCLRQGCKSLTSRGSLIVP